jgi:multimeric flavodoxin WrbA
MYLVVIKGSYRKKGSTNSLLDSLIDGFKKQNPKATVEIIDLIDNPLEFCEGCRHCCTTDKNAPLGKCIKKDGMHLILQKLLKADRVVLASPIYFGTVTSLMKRFIERGIALGYYDFHAVPYNRNKIDKTKKGVSLVCSGCPAPINWLFMLTWPAFRIFKMFQNLVKIGNIKKLAASNMQQTYFEKRAHKLGIWLGK